MPSLQDTILGRTLAFNVMKGEFVQVLHSGSCHWIAISTIACPPSTVTVYDSLYSALPTQAKEQICSLLCTQDPVIKLNFANIQLQANSSDCGLFALAFATALCEGKRPEELHFKRDLLRPHLLQCLEEGKMTSFPSKVVRRGQKVKRVDSINVFCRCRTQEGGRMIACTSCSEWFHEECVEVPEEAWDQLDYRWLCKNCC